MDLEHKKNFLINFAYWSLIGLLALLGIRYILPISLPFVFGFLFAYLIVAFSAKIGCKRRWLRLLLAILFYSAIGLFLGLITHWLIQVIREGAAMLPALYNGHLLPMLNDFTAWADATFHGMDPELLKVLQNLSRSITDSLGKFVSFLSKGLVNLVSGAASGVPSTVLSVIVMIFSTLFIVMDAERIQEFAKANMPPKCKAVCGKIREYLTGTLMLVVRSYMMIMLVTFIELTILFLIFGIQNPVAKASLIAVLDILPLLGTGGVLIPWAIISMVAGSVGKGIRLLIIYGIVTVVRQYIEPRIVGTQLGLHPIISLISMFLGLRLFGFLGMFGLPLAVSFFWKEYRDKNPKKEPVSEKTPPTAT